MISPDPHLNDSNPGAAPQPPPVSVEELSAALARPAQPAPRRRGRRPVVLTVALAAVAAVTATGSAALSRQQNGEPKAAAASAPEGPAAPTIADPVDAPENVPADSRGGRPAAGGRDVGLLVAPPQGVVWELFEGVAVPTSPADGPHRIDGPVHSGFTRTATGALLAAAQIGVRRIVTPDVDDLRTVNEKQLLPGPGRTAFLNLILGQQDTGAASGTYTQYAGFQMLAFTPDLAVLSLVTRSRLGVLQANTTTLRWSGGDWKIELPASGLERPRVLPDLTGFVPWSGVS